MSDFDDRYVLIIEDNRSDVKVLQSLLRQLNIDCDSLDGYEFMNEFMNVSIPDVIFLDLEMPGVNGYEIISALQESPDFQHIPVVAYSSHSSEMANARQAGFHSFLGKPLNSSSFADQLRRIINNEPVWEVR